MWLGSLGSALRVGALTCLGLLGLKFLGWDWGIPYWIHIGQNSVSVQPPFMVCSPC